MNQKGQYVVEESQCVKSYMTGGDSHQLKCQSEIDLIDSSFVSI